jgi:hypothetical protein
MWIQLRTDVKKKACAYTILGYVLKCVNYSRVDGQHDQETYMTTHLN